jgi:alcohol dehydrogenase class IV
MIDHALKFNIPAAGERFKTMAMILGLKDATPEGFIRWLGQLKTETGIPQRLTEAGVKKEQLEALCDFAVQDSCHGNNPRPCTRDDFKKIFSEAL